MFGDASAPAGIGLLAYVVKELKTPVKSEDAATLLAMRNAIGALCLAALFGSARFGHAAPQYQEFDASVLADEGYRYSEEARRWVDAYDVPIARLELNRIFASAISARYWTGTNGDKAVSLQVRSWTHSLIHDYDISVSEPRGKSRPTVVFASEKKKQRGQTTDDPEKKASVMPKKKSTRLKDAVLALGDSLSRT